MELASRFWRAMGFADVGQARALTEADVLALRRLSGLVEAGLLSETMAVQVARSTGQTTARLADWQIDSFLMGLTEPPEPGMTRNEVTFPLVQLLLPELEEFLVYVWRRQLAAATGRVVQAQDDEEMVNRRQAIGFADLVGFTRLTRRLEEEELGELVEAFETTAADLVAAHGGRLIKALGDEILYVAEDAGTAAEIGLRLIETMANDETMPELRVGIAFGTMTTRMGDVFGNTVNLANAAHLDSAQGHGAGRRRLPGRADRFGHGSRVGEGERGPVRVPLRAPAALPASGAWPGRRRTLAAAPPSGLLSGACRRIVSPMDHSEQVFGEWVRVRRDGHVAELVLDRKGAMNAVSTAFAEALAEACAALAADDGVRATVLTSTHERAFCVGADLKERNALSDAELGPSARAPAPPIRGCWSCRCPRSPPCTASRWAAATNSPCPAT